MRSQIFSRATPCCHFDAVPRSPICLFSLLPRAAQAYSLFQATQYCSRCCHTFCPRRATLDSSSQLSVWLQVSDDPVLGLRPLPHPVRLPQAVSGVLRLPASTLRSAVLVHNALMGPDLFSLPLCCRQQRLPLRPSQTCVCRKFSARPTRPTKVKTPQPTSANTGQHRPTSANDILSGQQGPPLV